MAQYLSHRKASLGLLGKIIRNTKRTIQSLFAKFNHLFNSFNICSPNPNHFDAM